MSEVWCVVGGSDGRDRYLAEALIQSGHTVAVIKENVSDLAMLVNRYGDAILPIELRDAEEGSLLAGLDGVHDSLGPVDTIAVILEHWVGEDAVDLTSVPRPVERRLFALLAASLPGSAVVVVTGETDANEQDRLTTQMLNSALESRLRRVLSSLEQPNRALSVVAIDAFSRERAV